MPPPERVVVVMVVVVVAVVVWWWWSGGVVVVECQQVVAVGSGWGGVHLLDDEPLLVALGAREGLVTMEMAAQVCTGTHPRTSRVSDEMSWCEAISWYAVRCDATARGGTGRTMLLGLVFGRKLLVAVGALDRAHPRRRHRRRRALHERANARETTLSATRRLMACEGGGGGGG
jgi:hypothetical protein